MSADYDEKYMILLKQIVLAIINPQKIMVFLFGSRVSGHHARGADADIGLLADDKLPANLYHQIRNAIDESILPWKVDIVDFTRVDPAFKEDVLKDIVIWNKPEVMKSVTPN